MAQRLFILGSTGSIGDSTFEALRRFPEVAVVGGISYHSNFQKAIKLHDEFRFEHVCCTNQNMPADEIAEWKRRGVNFHPGIDGLLDADYDSLLSAVVGSIGVRPTLKAANAGKRILLANKESLVMAGTFIMEAASAKNAEILPVDSEHNSVFRLLRGNENVDEIVLTASGGPFRDSTLEEIAGASKDEVLDHPTWDMGAKITVDSAGMINKALEIIEAHHLFGYSYDKINAVIHPQSYVHAMVRHQDGSWNMHAGEADMKIPILHCLYYPNEPPALESPKEPGSIPDLTFREITEEKYPGFFLGVEAGRKGGVYPAVFNAANEEAVASFLADKISFTRIPELIEEALNETAGKFDSAELEEVFEADSFARETVRKNIEGSSHV